MSDHLAPEVLAEADRVHTAARNLYEHLSRDYVRHRDNCDDADCVATGDEMVVARMSIELATMARRCAHQDCLEHNVEAICGALAYAVVHAAAGGPTPHA